MAALLWGLCVGWFWLVGWLGLSLARVWWRCGAPPPLGLALLGAVCGAAVRWGLPLLKLITSLVANYMYTSGSGQTKPFFLGKSYGLLKVINMID